MMERRDLKGINIEEN